MVSKNFCDRCNKEAKFQDCYGFKLRKPTLQLAELDISHMDLCKACAQQVFNLVKK